MSAQEVQQQEAQQRVALWQGTCLRVALKRPSPALPAWPSAAWPRLAPWRVSFSNATHRSKDREQTLDAHACLLWAAKNSSKAHNFCQPRQKTGTRHTFLAATQNSNCQQSRRVTKNVCQKQPKTAFCQAVAGRLMLHMAGVCAFRHTLQANSC